MIKMNHFCFPLRLIKNSFLKKRVILSLSSENFSLATAPSLVFIGKMKNIIIPKSEVQRFITDCMVKTGVPPSHSEQLAQVLVAGDERGHFSHGLNRLEMYVNDIKTKVCDGQAVPSILKESPATALIDGNNGLGPVIGNFSMELAIKKAKEIGVGWVSVRNTNHFGIAGWYSLKAMEENLIGMAFTNTSPFLTPTRSKQRALGTNPISLAAPGVGGDQFVLDMATTAVAVGKIEIQKRKGEAIPEGWAQDRNGKITTNPTVAMESNCLTPLGGLEINSGYKGYGLSLMVEIFCGILSDAAYGPNVRQWMNTTVPANLGQCYVAIDPSFFAPNFEYRLSDLLNSLRKLESIDESKPVWVAGDMERLNVKKVADEGGIGYHINQIEASKNLAVELGVEPMSSI